MPQGARASNPHAARRAALVEAALPTGGWPYYPDRASRIEPTCWALLALGPAGVNPREAEALAHARTFLRALQRPDGLLVEPGTPGPNYGWNGLALLALNGREDLDIADRLANGLLKVKGIQIESTEPGVIRQDSMLQAWSWTEGTFSWIEPTAYCLLALKVRQVGGADVASRIREAEAVLFDRVAEPGGWNYGNAQVLSQDLRPYVPTTALGLLALQDQREHPGVTRSLAWLEAHALAEPSTMALSLAAAALSVYGRRIEHVLAALEAQQARTRALGNMHLAAMAAYASSLPAHHGVALTVPQTSSPPS
jgi:hypothetical protein